MVELIAKSACEGLLPLSIGSVTAEEPEYAVMTSLSAFADPSALDAALSKAHGLELPLPGQSTSKGGLRCLWFGRDSVMLIGVAPDPALVEHGAVVDQSDAWARVTLSGAGAVDVLARLVPVDLRAAVFRLGQTARTQLGHMQASITRTAPDGFEIMVFRSMAGSLVHDLKRAMAAVSMRG
ncbi:sarcosine oxidase subunit gamma [Sulfitobacter sp. F26204]|uniref:sarcosine oxidase subunit gamma n=1 Tax=Sulfitobacter sp. F26204 TaxID=2996014 RepID=UPI00225E4645|nr:sarcosine oxidase subunit gamma family protein [Sulfitobacter sp. F26204]MCX7560853.1 sarcosine oxidase subunit gamma [Sulfitobacter sp. F26204]